MEFRGIQLIDYDEIFISKEINDDGNARETKENEAKQTDYILLDHHCHCRVQTDVNGFNRNQ